MTWKYYFRDSSLKFQFAQLLNSDEMFETVNAETMGWGDVETNKSTNN